VRAQAKLGKNVGGGKLLINRCWTKVVLAALVSAVVFVASPRAFASATGTFPRPATIEPNVKFWVDVFTAYSERDFIVMDRDNVWRIYQVYRMPGEGMPTRDDIEWTNAYLKAKYGDMLNRLACGQGPVTYEDRRVAAMFKGESPSAFAAAAQNLRVQEGMREQFHNGLLRSRYYRTTMERVFRNAGLPPELVTLAQIESGFQGRARSGAGAVGIWQFTRDTGKKYMKINRYHDDRLDPARETRAAASLLRANYETFGDWPLAITAYNYGSSGVARAASIYNGDYCQMVRRYNGPHFGFAVKNYYAEFLAAMQVHRYEDKYFPGIADEAAIRPPKVKCDLARAHTSKKPHSSASAVSSKSHHRKKPAVRKV